MNRHFDEELRELKENLLRMGGFVESAIDEAAQALLLRDPSRVQKVEKFESDTNRCHVEIDEACMKILARQQPMAIDLRLILAIIKINSDLERMGDQATNIAQNAEKYLGFAGSLPVGTHIPEMAGRVKGMLRNALDSFVRGDAVLARRVLDEDDAVDDLKKRVLTQLTDDMKKSSSAIDRGLALILIARNMERLGDHATNIAEDVIFVVTGEDIRHGRGKKIEKNPDC